MHAIFMQHKSRCVFHKVKGGGQDFTFREKIINSIIFLLVELPIGDGRVLRECLDCNKVWGFFFLKCFCCC